MLKKFRVRAVLILCATACLLHASDLQAQQLKSPLDSGFQKSSGIASSVDEMLGVRQVRAASEPVFGPGYPNLWMMEIQMKPVRMRRMEVVDPETGQRSDELVWYLIYRLIPKDYTAIAGNSQDELRLKLQNPAMDPENPEDGRRSLPIITPEFVIVTNDNTGSHIYRDQVNLEVQAAVLKREFLRNRQFAGSSPVPELSNSVGAITTAPDVLDDLMADDDELAGARYGVAVWRNIDPRTDFFTLYVHGLSNGFRLRTEEDGQVVLETKTVTQEFRRPGDQYLQDETEFRFEGDPVWQYLPSETAPPTDDRVQILRNLDHAEPAAPPEG